MCAIWRREFGGVVVGRRVESSLFRYEVVVFGKVVGGEVVFG